MGGVNTGMDREQPTASDAELDPPGAEACSSQLAELDQLPLSAGDGDNEFFGGPTIGLKAIRLIALLPIVTHASTLPPAGTLMVRPP